MPDIKSRILIVEDQAIVAIDIQSQLETLGYLVVGTAASAAEACQKAATLAPDLVLMDVHLGDAIDGIDAATTPPRSPTGWRRPDARSPRPRRLWCSSSDRSSSAASE